VAQQGLRTRLRSLNSAASAANRTRSRFGRIAPLLVLPTAWGAAVYSFGLPLQPDASYYVGGVSLFPSPLGTVLGTAGGYTGLALLNAAAAFAIILLVALLALELGNRPLVAQGLALLVAPAEWFRDWGMDAPAVALLLAAALLQLRGRSRGALSAAALAAATHLAALPLALGAIVVQARRSRTVVIALGLAAAGAVIAARTAYATAFDVLLEPHAFVEGAHELVLACWPILLLSPVATLHPRVRLLVFGSALGAIVAGAIPATVGQFGLTRYAVPCLFIATAGIRFRRVIRFRRAVLRPDPRPTI
jgi:hypothetical protein